MSTQTQELTWDVRISTGSLLEEHRISQSLELNGGWFSLPYICSTYLMMKAITK